MKKVYTKQELERCGVRELVVIVRDMGLGGAWTTSAHKDQLVKAIITRRAPVPVPPEIADALAIFVTAFVDMVEAERRRRENE